LDWAIKANGGRKAAIRMIQLKIYLGRCELEPCKAKTGEEAECTFVHEHSESVFNAAGPTRSKSK
jgi:hypothetical protein